MKKQKQPGDNISLKMKKNEDPAILDWINAQSNLMDSIRYLIENEVTGNGIRNLQQHIPADRSFTFEASADRSRIPEEDQHHHKEDVQTLSEDMSEIQITDDSVEDDIDDEDIESWM